MIEVNYNPDVLSCLANLSNDEVFTPPALANQILDQLPAELWSDKNATFLDPVCKSGVFLREIAKRLVVGLESEFPDVQERVNHIFTKQLFGIAITELTALLSRRSVYCSKSAESKFSVCEGFENSDGNITFNAIKHKWKKGRCEFCGASKAAQNRDDTLEAHAYEFIHTDKPESIFKMKFDVIIGNPPYQLNDGGAKASAIPIYHKFVQQAKKLNPRFLTMIIPSRYFSGGRVGELQVFRDEMLDDRRVRVLHDFPRASDCFPGVEIKGGVNYFLWDRDNLGECEVHTHDGSAIVSSSKRNLREDGLDIFIRDNNAIPILKKIKSANDPSFAEIVSANDPFGFDIRQENSMKRVKPNYKLTRFQNSVPFYYNGWRSSGLGYIAGADIRKNPDWINSLKIFVPKAVGTGDTATDHIKPFIPEPESCCSETYIVIGPFSDANKRENCRRYIGTKFFHFMVGIIKNTQESRRNVYSLVPLQDFSESWDDQKLFEKYGLSEDERDYIMQAVRPMEMELDL